MWLRWSGLSSRDPSQHCGKYTRISTLPPGQVGSVPNVPV